MGQGTPGRRATHSIAPKPSVPHIGPMSGRLEDLRTALAGRYEIERELGHGAMATVYLAQDLKHDRKVALKFLPPGMAADPDVRARFMQEAKAASALNHPNVCTIHDIQEHEGRMYIVMEHVDGGTLTDKKGQLSLKKAIDVMAQVADGC